MDFAELKTLLRALGYGSADDTIQGLMVNEAYRRVGRRRAWSWLRAEASLVLTPGTSEYTWTDFGIDQPRRLESARLIDTNLFDEPQPLKWLEPQSYSNLRGDPSTVWTTVEWDEPEWWTRTGSTGIGLWYPPDSGYTLSLAFFENVPTLTDGDTPVMPSDYHDVIVYEAAYWMAMRQRDQIAITEMRAERDSVLAQLEAEDSVAQLQTTEHMGGKEIWESMERY